MGKIPDVKKWPLLAQEPEKLQIEPIGAPGLGGSDSAGHHRAENRHNRLTYLSITVHFFDGKKRTRKLHAAGRYSEE